jgi:hypothetical protein
MVENVNLTPVMMMLAGWLMITPGARKSRLLPVLGMLVISAAMFKIVQGRY